MSEIKNALLEKIFSSSIERYKGPNAVKFRAEHHEHLDLLDELEAKGSIGKKDGDYYLKLLTISDLHDNIKGYKEFKECIKYVYFTLRNFYLNHPGESIDLDTLSQKTDIKRDFINLSLSYLIDAPIYQSISNNLFEKNASIAPSEWIIRHNTYDEMINEMRSWRNNKTTEVTEEKVDTFHFNKEDQNFRLLLHPIVEKNAYKQYIDGHLRDSVLNSIVAIFDFIREKTGLKEDGDNLIGKAFSLDNPYLILSDLDTDSGKNDQKGFMQIIKGSYQGIRNPKAHSLTNDLTEIKAAQYLVFASLLARRIDEAKLVKK